MDFSQFNWVSGFDRSGIIALSLFAVFFIIVLIIVFMMLKINTENKRSQQEKIDEDDPPTASKPTRPAPPKIESENESPKIKSENSDPLEQAEIYLAYGLNKQAIDLLEEYLKENPSDKNASKILAKAQQ
jgi:hypothetical protein